MKLNHCPQTPQGQLMQRASDVWHAHPECQLAVGDVSPMSAVASGEVCVIMVAVGPLMISRYCPAKDVRWLMDTWST